MSTIGGIKIVDEACVNQNASQLSLDICKSVKRVITESIFCNFDNVLLDTLKLYPMPFTSTIIDDSSFVFNFPVTDAIILSINHL